MPDGLKRIFSFFDLTYSNINAKRKEAGIPDRTEEDKNGGGKIMHLFLLAVRSDYLNRGLGYELCKRTMDLAVEKGFRECLVEATSPGTAWICE